MRKLLTVIPLTLSLNAIALAPSEMLIIVGAVKYYNENCTGLNYQGMRKMNTGLKRFKMNKTPVFILERDPLAVSGYQIAQEFGCQGTKDEARKAGYGAYIN